jgi:adenylosuccinate lyase
MHGVQPLQRQLQRLTEIRKRLFVIQLGGAVGTLSVYGDKAQSLVDAFSIELGLQPFFINGIRNVIIFVNSLTGFRCLQEH